jgi:hypothetical protein
MMNAIVAGKRPALPAGVCPPRMRALIETAWGADPAARPDFTELRRPLEDSALMELEPQVAPATARATDHTCDQKEGETGRETGVLNSS